MAALGSIIVIAAAFAAIYYLFKSARSQAFGFFPYRANTGQKIIALTFDDGPNPPHTAELLAVLEKHRVRATFFLVGQNLRKYPELGKELLRRGHVVGNHSEHHAFSKYFSEPGYEKEMRAAQETIQQILGVAPALFRPPWLVRNPFLMSAAKKLGLQPISGLFGSEMEVLQVSPEAMAARAASKARPGAILIFHDGFDARGGNRANTVRAIDLLIPKLKSQGYSFATVDELLAIPAYQQH